MRLFLLALVPWMAMTVAQAQSPQAASVAFTHLGAFQQDVWRAGDECFVPPSLLERWGWTVRIQGGEAGIEAEGRRLRVLVAQIRGAASVNLTEALRQLGAFAEWEAGSATLRVLGALRMVTFEGTAMRLDATLGMRAHAFTLERPERLVFDLTGVRLPPGGLAGLPDGVRAGQREPNVVRVVVERPGASRLSPAVPAPGRSLTFDLAPLRFEGPGEPAGAAPPAPAAGPGDPAPDTPAQPGPAQPGPAQPGPAQPGPAQPGPVQVGPAQVVRESATEATVVLPLSRPLIIVPTAEYLDPRTITLTIPNAAVAPVAGAPAPPAPGETVGEQPPEPEAPPTKPPAMRSEFVEGVELLAEGAGAVRAVVRLRRPMAFLLSTQRSQVELRLVAVRGADGRLAGKTIVVDAGHGGRDSGAIAPDGSVMEKTLNLRVSREIARRLAAEGANVIMTRNDDVRVPLNERPAIANRARAHAFVSVHFNSNRIANSRSGTMTFHHRQDPQSVLLAECLNGEIAKVTGLPDLGVRSDTTIHRSGFAVLRNARVPAVLLELGFINHRTDRARMVLPEFQGAVAEAVVRGLKVFFGDEQASRQTP
jgi:N-acetylmuramoyl-L-alanine amidase